MKYFAMKHPILTFLIVDETITLIQNCVAMVTSHKERRVPIAHEVPEGFFYGLEKIADKVKEFKNAENVENIDSYRSKNYKPYSE